MLPAHSFQSPGEENPDAASAFPRIGCVSTETKLQRRGRSTECRPARDTASAGLIWGEEEPWLSAHRAGDRYVGFQS